MCGKLHVRVFGTLSASLVIAALAMPCAAVAAPDLASSGREIESHLLGFPQRAMTTLAELMPQAMSAPPEQRRYIQGLHVWSMVQAGRTADALLIADRVETEARTAHDEALAATALLMRSSAAAWIGNIAGANTLANDARSGAKRAGDLFLLHWAALAAGSTARQLGQHPEALARLNEALAYADEDKDSNRRTAVRYQLSMLHVALKQPEKALAESAEALKQARLANNVYAMARARISESEAYRALNNPKQELASLAEALAIARNGGSRVTEALALVKLAELHLRRRDYAAALDVSRQSVNALDQIDDFALLATAKANMGFALLATGQTEAGKRLVDAALVDWERAQSTSGVAWLFGRYAQYLAGAGDFKSALVMSEQERAWAVRYEAEKYKHEIELLNRDKALQVTDLKNQRLQQAIAWGIALVSASFLLLTAILYRKLQTIRRLEGEKIQLLNQQSTHDPLTSLFNRRYFEALMESEGTPQVRRRGGEEKIVRAFLLIDLDHFKQINDRHGHAMGDAVLVEIARRLQSALRESDVCVRWGGEEFLIFVRATNLDTLEELALRILRTVGSEPVAFQGSSIRVTASIGYLPQPLPPDGVLLPWLRAIGLADKACYLAKNHGRNCAFGIHAVSSGDASSLAEMERDLEAAWKQGFTDIHSLAGPRDSGSDVAPGNAITDR